MGFIQSLPKFSSAIWLVAVAAIVFIDAGDLPFPNWNVLVIAGALAIDSRQFGGLSS